MSDPIVIAKIGDRNGEPFVTAISVQTDVDPHTVGRVLLEHYPLDTDANNLLNQGNLATLLPLSTAAADPAQATYAQPVTLKHFLESDWLGTAAPQWIYVHDQGNWLSLPVVDGAILHLLVRVLT